MMKFVRMHWRHISTGLLALTLLGAGGTQLYQTLRGDDCCAPGSPCCHPGSPCCHHGK